MPKFNNDVSKLVVNLGHGWVINAPRKVDVIIYAYLNIPTYLATIW